MEGFPISTFPFLEFVLVKCLAICPRVSVVSYLALIVLISYQVMHTFCIRQATPDGILSCAMTRKIQSQHAMPSTEKFRGSLDVESRSYHASAALKPLLSSVAFLSVSSSFFFFFFPSAVHKAYLQVSAGVAGRLPSRHLTAALLPRAAHSFPGFVQSTTALLVLLCNPAPSAPHRSLSAPV